MKNALTIRDGGCRTGILPVSIFLPIKDSLKGCWRLAGSNTTGYAVPKCLRPAGAKEIQMRIIIQTKFKAIQAEKMMNRRSSACLAEGRCQSVTSSHCQLLPATLGSGLAWRPWDPWNLALLWSLDVGIWMFIPEAYVNLCKPMSSYVNHSPGGTHGANRPVFVSLQISDPNTGDNHL